MAEGGTFTSRTVSGSAAVAENPEARVAVTITTHSVAASNAVDGEPTSRGSGGAAAKAGWYAMEIHEHETWSGRWRRKDCTNARARREGAEGKAVAE